MKLVQDKQQQVIRSLVYSLKARDIALPSQHLAAARRLAFWSDVLYGLMYSIVRYAAIVTVLAITLVLYGVTMKVMQSSNYTLTAFLLEYGSIAACVTFVLFIVAISILYVLMVVDAWLRRVIESLANYRPE